MAGLTKGTLVKAEGRTWRVGLVNACRARLDPVSGMAQVSPVNGRTFTNYGTSINVSPTSHLPVADESTLSAGERYHLLTLIERELEAEMGAVAETPVGAAPETTASKKANKNTAANEDRKAKLAATKEEKAKLRQSTAKAPKEPKPCKCGCGAQTGGYFVPGHDAKFKSWLLQIERGTKKPEELLTEAVRKSYTWKRSANGKGLVPTTNYKGEPHTGYDTAEQA